MDVGIVAQKDNERAATLAGRLRDRLSGEGVETAFDRATADALDGTSGRSVDGMSACDLVVSIGGDGTFLFTARGASGTPILGVNLGEVGFLNAVGPDDAVDAVLDAVEAHRAGRLDVREVPRIVARADGWTSNPAMNEVVVQGPRRGHGGGATIEVRVDGSTYAAGHADGVLVSTPTGSTAYNLSERGPLVHPGVEGLVVTQLAPEVAMPSLVVPPDSEVSIHVADADHAVVVGDGRARRDLDAPVTVTVAQSDDPVRLAGPAADFFQALGKLD